MREDRCPVSEKKSGELMIRGRERVKLEKKRRRRSQVDGEKTSSSGTRMNSEKGERNGPLPIN